MVNSSGILHGQDGLREVSVKDLVGRKKPRYMVSSVVLASQFQSYAVCVEWIREWFLEKFPSKYFNSVYVEGKHAFDEFRKFSTIDQQMKKVNPICAIIPNIDVSNNRQWIDSSPEFPMLLRRSRFEGVFFSDNEKCNSKHLQIMFKTVLVNVTFKVRNDTRAEQLDMCETLKLRHRAGYSESRNIALDVHVPREVIAQIAKDKGFELNDDLTVKEPMKMLKYLNSHSVIPFIYKLRCSTGNNEFFIKVPNCVVHIKSELPTVDDGERQDMFTTNFTTDMTAEVEMTAPYAFSYYSECEQTIINSKPINTDGNIAVMRANMTQVPQVDEHGWNLLTVTEYLSEEMELDTVITIDFNELFNGTDIKRVIDYTLANYINPYIFLNFKIFNDGCPREYHMDWSTLKCVIRCPITNITTVIGIYADMNYVNNTIINLNEIGTNRID